MGQPNGSGKPKKGKSPKRKNRKKKVTPELQETEAKLVRFEFNDGKSFVMDCATAHMPNLDRIELEEYMQMPIAEMVMSGWIGSSKATTFYAFLARRAHEEDFKVEDAIESFTVLEEVEDEDPPTQTPSGTQDSSGSQS